MGRRNGSACASSRASAPPAVTDVVFAGRIDTAEDYLHGRQRRCRHVGSGRLSYLDSHGVAMLFRLSQLASRSGGSLTLANPQNLVRRVIQITHLEDAVAIIHDV